MEAKRKVYLFGNSVILGTLGASLRRRSRFEVTGLIPPLPGYQELAAQKPDVVLFDLEATPNEAILTLLESCPRLLLIGVSPDNNLVKIWTRQQRQELSTQDLLEIINGQLNA